MSKIGSSWLSYRYTATPFERTTRSATGGTKWIGTDGWVWVDRGGLDANPKSLLKEQDLRRQIQLYRSPEGSDCAGCVAAGFELHAQVILRLWIFGIDFDGFAELGEGTRVIALTAQRHSEQRVRRCELGIKSEGATKLSRSAIQIAELSLGQPQL